MKLEWRIVGMEEFIRIEKMLQKELKESRYEHTLGVRYTAATLAMRYQVDIYKAQIAGLLHDCAKMHSNQEFLDLAEVYKLKVTKNEKETPHLLHAKLGAVFAKEKYGVSDEEILDAIRYHTIGRAGMTKLEQIIFISDYIEPNRREIPGLDTCRKLAYEDLNEATYTILKNTLLYLKSKNGMEQIDETTVHAYEYYKDLLKKGE